MTPSTHLTTAADGWPLMLRHYPAEGANPHREPVILQHGLGACSQQFDLPVPRGVRAPSLARWLASRGYDVWVPDLRGVGGSASPGASLRGRWDWSFDDHLDLDMPEILRFVLAQAGHEHVHWIGHSMGGILLLAWCARHGSSQIRSGTVLAGSLDYSGASSAYDLIRPLKRLGRLVMRVPSGSAARIFAPLAGRFHTPVEASFYHSPNLAGEAARALIREAHHDVSGEILFQLASLFAKGGLTSLDGRVRYADRLEHITTPILFGVGDRDVQCAPEVVERTFRQVGSPPHALRKFGLAHGDAQPYGHFDLLCGRRSDTEVFPELLSWMTAHPISARPAA